MKLTVNVPPDVTMGGRWEIVSGVGDAATYSYGDYEGKVWMH